MIAGPLPGIRLAWDEYAGPDTFIRYNVLRRPRRSLLDAHTTALMAENGSRVMLQVADILNSVQGGVAVRCSLPWDNASEPEGGAGTPTIFDWRDDSNNYLTLYYDEATNAWVFERAVGGSTATASVAASVVEDAAVTLIARWDADGIGLSYNGAAFVTDTLAAGELTEDLADIGTQAGFSASDAEVAWLIGFAGELTDADAATIHAFADDVFGDYPPTFVPFRSVDAETVPTGLWVGGEDAAYKVETAAWVTLAGINDSARTFYSDRRANSGQVYEYALTVTASVFGQEIDSDVQTVPVVSSVRFRGTALHNVHDESDYVRVSVRATRVQPEQEKAYVQARGRTKKTAQFGELDASRIRLEPVLRPIEEPEEWDILRRLFTAQRENGAIFMVRPGHMPEGYYVQIDALQRDDVLVISDTGLELQEVYFDEE